MQRQIDGSISPFREGARTRESKSLVSVLQNRHGMAGEVESGREDDCIEYYLFFKEFNCTIASPEVEEALESKCSDIKALVAPHVHEYIWHLEPFNVVTKNSSNSSTAHDSNENGLPPHLYGKTRFGDNIEDEWFIVFLLLELTKQVEGLVVRVVDSDGEFLLIEAADALPEWAVPEKCEGRVFLCGGAVHLLPPADGDASPSVARGVGQVLRDPARTTASEGVQRAVRLRVEVHPFQARAGLHSARAYVPVGVAALLNAKPNLIAPAVQAFCNRDLRDAKVCRAMRFFPPETRVMRNVLFTKCLYAMVLHHSYNPDKRSGWNLPPPNSPEFKSHSLGMKIACGFEILVGRQGKVLTPGEEPEVCDLAVNPRWNLYVKSLEKFGYFQNLLAGSKDYNRLMEQAKSYFVSHYSADLESTYSHEILNLLQSTEYSIEEFKKEEHDLCSPDDESWLEISPEELDKMLEQRYGTKKVSDSGDTPSHIAGHISKFLNHISDLEGAEHPKNSPKRLPQQEGKAMDVDEDAESTNKINFDPDQFSCAVQNILDFVVPEDNWDLESDASSMSSYEHELDMDLNQLKSSKKKEKAPRCELKQYMDQMDRELSSTCMGKSFEGAKGSRQADDSLNDAEDFRPVDIDANAVRNLLASYQAQMGGAGPSTNMLGPMGVRLEGAPDADENDKDAKRTASVANRS